MADDRRHADEARGVGAAAETRAVRATDAAGPLWTPPPPRAAATNLAAFMDAVRRRHGVDVADGPDTDEKRTIGAL